MSEHGRRRHPAESRVQREERRVDAEVSLAEQTKLAVAPDVSAALEPVDPVDDGVGLDQV